MFALSNFVPSGELFIFYFLNNVISFIQMLATIGIIRRFSRLVTLLFHK
jgi:hypothetical protein